MPSTAPDPDDRYRRVRVTRRLHPLSGRDFEFVVHRRNWGEDRVYCRDQDGELFSLPAALTDAAPADPFVVVAAGRCPFTADGLLAVADLIGVPLVLVPLGRDQPDNAARVVHAGAGIRLRKNASVSVLRAAVGRVIDDPSYRAAAGVMAARLGAERDENRVVDELERVAAGGHATGGSSTRP